MARGPGVASGNFVNRGNYLCPLNAIWLVGAAAGTIVIATAGSINTITVPASTGNRIIRYKGIDKLVTFEENDVETPRLGAITFGTMTTHPLIPAGTTAYSITYAGVTAAAGSHLWLWETYA